MRLAVLHTGDPLVESARVDSITPVPPYVQENEDDDQIGVLDSVMGVHYNVPYPFHLPGTPGFPASDKNADVFLQQKPFRPKRRTVHVGERSVYGTEDSEEMLLDDTSQNLFPDEGNIQGTSQQLHINDFSGDTLSSSKVQVCSTQGYQGVHLDHRLSVPRKRGRPVRAGHTASRVRVTNEQHAADDASDADESTIDDPFTNSGKLEQDDGSRSSGTSFRSNSFLNRSS